MLYDYLVENYKPGEPIFSIDISIEGLSDENMRQQFKVLTDNKKLNRFENGIYYIPKLSRLKGYQGLSSELVARYKYIARRGHVIGYYTGNTLANHLGISEQVPVKEEIVSNNMSAIVREVQVGKRTFIVRKPKVTVTESNYKVLQLLDLLKELDLYINDNVEYVREKLAAYVRNNNIKRADIDRYIEFFPMKTYKFIYVMRLDNVFA